MIDAGVQELPKSDAKCRDFEYTDETAHLADEASDSKEQIEEQGKPGLQNLQRAGGHGLARISNRGSGHMPEN